MHRIFIYLCLLFPEIVLSQNLLSGKVSSLEGEVLEYASIEYLNSPIGVISNSKGEFSLHKIPGDSILISAVGFIPLIIKIDSSTSFIQASLIKNYQLLSTIVVKNKPSSKILHVEMGHYSKKDDYWALFGHKQRSAVYIPNSKKIIGNIETIKFKLADFKKSNYLLRIRLVSVDTITGFPDKDLLLEDNILKPSAFRHINRFSIKTKYIQLPQEGIFVSFEWLPLSGDLSTEENPPHVLGNTKADDFYMFTNYKGTGWHKSIWRFAGSDSIGVPNISIIVAY